jgi:DNA-binding GntR family transcriptional regulator
MAQNTGDQSNGLGVNPTRTLTDQAYVVLEELIVTLRLAPGAVLSESALSEQLEIGRTPIREALQRLSREGLITILPRKGILVTEINPRSQLLLLEVRRELKRLLARTGAIRATKEERERFREIADGMKQAGHDNDEISFMRLDDALNKLIADAAHNEYANRAIGLTHGLSRRFWYMNYKEAADLPLAATLHADLAKAIADAKPDDAAAACDRLIDYVETFTRTTVQVG